MGQKLLIKNILISYLYLSFSTPIIFLLIGLPMILHLQNLSPAAIGLFQLVSIPYIIAFLFSPIIEGIAFKKSHYKKWILIFTIIYIVLLFMISNFSLKENYYLLFCLILLTVFTSTLLDIPLNALATKIFTKEEQSSAGGFKSTAYFSSAIIGNGVMLLIYNIVGWKYTIFSIILLMLPSLFILYFIEERNNIVHKKTIQYNQIIKFFQQKNILIWLIILVTYFMFLSPLWVFLKPYLLSKGFEANTVAALAGLLGSFIAVAGSLGFSFFAKNLDKKLLLFRFTFFSFFTICLFLVLEFFDLPFFYILICIFAIALSKALSTSILFAMIMNNCREEYKAIDYSVQLSLSATGRVLFGMIAGILIEMFTYKGLFIVCFVGMLIVVFLVYRYLKSSY